MKVNPEKAVGGVAQSKAGREELLTARQACAFVGIKAATLYTYVSRGMLLPVHQAGSKVSLYRREELEGLQLRSTARAGHGAVAAQAMHFGQPILISSITEITPAGPRYRGHLATDLATTPGSFESVCELLWSGALPPHAVDAWPAEPMHTDVRFALDGMSVARDEKPRVLRMFAVATTALDVCAANEELEEGSATRFSRQLLFAFAGCCGVLGPQRRFIAPTGEAPLAKHVLAALGSSPTLDAVRALNVALILGADHELSSPTFAARIAASVGSNLHACIVAGLATQRGAALAAGGDAIEDLMRGFTSVERLRQRVAEAKHGRELLPSFGHPLYPQGDPRATVLMRLARASGRGLPQAEIAFQFIDTVEQELGLHPNIEVGLAALSIAWGLPARSASALWGIGRTAGWIAHVLEQRHTGIALRPRGQFRSVAGEGGSSAERLG